MPLFYCLRLLAFACFLRFPRYQVQEALCDADGEVRDHAAAAFGTLHRMCGSEAVVDTVVPRLLSQLKKDESRHRALFGLCQVSITRMRTLFFLTRGARYRV